MSRILTIADIHLRPSDFEVKIKLLQRYLTEIEYDVCFILGDLFDNPRIGNKKVTANYMIEKLSQVFQCGKPIFIIEGNHDQAPGYSALSMLKGTSGVVLVQDKVECVEFTDFNAFMIPWYRNDPNYKKNVLMKLAMGAGMLDQHKPRILMGHVNISGSKMGMVSVNPDAYFCFDVDDFQYLRPNLGLFGHVHERQLLGNNLFYLGAMAQLNFGEENRPFGVGIIDTNGAEGEVTWKNFSLASPCYYTVNATKHDYDKEQFNDINHYRIYTEHPEHYDGLTNVKAIHKPAVTQSEKDFVDFFQEKELDIPELTAKYYYTKGNRPDNETFNSELKKISVSLQKPTTGLTSVRSVKWKNTKLGSKSIDFAPGLNCVMGNNGSGKTSLVESVFASLFHQFVERGHIKHFIEDDGYVEATLRYEQEVYRIIHSKKGKKEELYLEESNFDGTGQIMQSFTLVSIFDEKIQKVFGDKAQFLRLVFSDQNNQWDLVNCSDSERLEFLRGVFGLGYFDELSKHYKELEKEARQGLQELNQAIEAVATWQEVLDDIQVPSQQQIIELDIKISALANMIDFNTGQSEYVHSKLELKRVEERLEKLQTELTKWSWEDICRAKELDFLSGSIGEGCKKYSGIGCIDNPIKSCSLLKEYNQDKLDQVNLELEVLKSTLPNNWKELHFWGTSVIPTLERERKARLKELTDYVGEEPSCEVLSIEELKNAKTNLAMLKTKMEGYQSLISSSSKLIEKITVGKDSIAKHQLNCYQQRYDSFKELAELTGKHGLPILVLQSIINKLQAIVDELIYDSGLNIKLKLTCNLTSVSLYLNDIHSKLCSGGQKALIRIIMKLATMIYLNKYYGNYKVLIMDEPTAALDDTNTILVANLFKVAAKHFNQVIVVTHCEEFASVADHIIWIT